MVLVVLLLHPCSGRGQPTSGDLKKEIISLARATVGLKEIPKGSNWGRDVQAFLWHVRIKFPAPWCAAYLAYLFHQSCVDLEFSGYVPNWSRGEFKKYIAYTRGKSPRLTPSGVELCDLGTIYFPSQKRAAHIFIIIEIHPTYVVTVEGNSNSDGSREGWIVTLHQRSYNEIYELVRIL